MDDDNLDGSRDADDSGWGGGDESRWSQEMSMLANLKSKSKARARSAPVVQYIETSWDPLTITDADTKYELVIFSLDGVVSIYIYNLRFVNYICRD